jgi:hypothetical protein
MKNKQKAWRLGAVVMGRRARANKEAATLFGAIFRNNPERLSGTLRKRESLLVKHGRRQLCPHTGVLLAPYATRALA